MKVGAVTSTSSSLLARAKVLDEDAWQAIVILYSPVVLGWCRRAHLLDEDGADILQEVFRAIWQNIHRYDSARGSFRGWLKTITTRKILDSVRRRQQNPVAPGGSANHQQVHEVVDGWADESDKEIQTDEHRLIKRTAEWLQGEFEESTWRAFWLTTVEEQTAAMVAEELGMSRAAVYKAKSRVLKRLRDVLEGLL